ncbi:MAG: HAMP domain-containing sensor histidine kinase [Bacteroidia bacterium]|nr:HAMP domain-containing sensor histidine kinase [Bacteroidia bacterium]
MISLSIRTLTWLAVLIVAVAIIGGSLVYSNYLAQQLAAKERESVQLYAEALEIVSSPATTEDVLLNFLFDRVMTSTGADVPKIQVGETEQVAFHNLNIPNWIQGADTMRYILARAAEMEAAGSQVQVEFDRGRYNRVMYGESDLLRQLRWFPLAQLLVAFVFIGIVFAGFAVAQRSEQNRVWVGLAKETAHQLGTPVSSLMAWIELMRLRADENPDEKEMVDEMERDVQRLEMIAARFSKIGSEPELIEVSLREVLDHSAEYVNKRMTRNGSIRLVVDNQIPLDSTLYINAQLFDWVIENLLKNALDAIQQQEGQITIQAGLRGSQYYIDVSDTGKGIPKNHFEKVFEPGFTTKKRGWGLGLSLSRRIIQNYHRGRIFVKTSEPGKGTTFRILLPVTRHRPNRPPKKSKTHSPTT